MMSAKHWFPPWFIAPQNELWACTHSCTHRYIVDPTNSIKPHHHVGLVEFLEILHIAGKRHAALRCYFSCASHISQTFDLILSIPVLFYAKAVHNAKAVYIAYFCPSDIIPVSQKGVEL